MSTPGKSFMGGFWGCFGVLAAFVAVAVGGLGLLVALGLFGEATKPKVSDTPDPFVKAEPPPSLAVVTATNAHHCSRGVTEAGRRKLADRSVTALMVPWSITQVGGTDAQPIIECVAMEANQVRFVTVQVMCADDDKRSCTRFVGFSDKATP